MEVRKKASGGGRGFQPPLPPPPPNGTMNHPFQTAEMASTYV